MNPPFSVVFLTTLIGMGQGCFILLIIEQLKENLALSQTSPTYLIYSAATVMCLLIAGLIASFFHLGHPERAWRAVAGWRTSWLSREVLALPAFMGIVMVYLLLNLFPVFDIKISGLNMNLSILIGICGIFFALLLYFCTSMIYVSIRFLQQWNSRFTIANFMLIGLSSGAILLLTLQYIYNATIDGFSLTVAILITGAAAITRVLSIKRNQQLRPKSTIQTALGINNNNIKQTSSGAIAPTFNRHQFNHGKSLFFLRNIRVILFVFAFIIPVALLFLIAVNLAAPVTIVITIICQYLGLIAERWYFFADANHPQNLYYQVIG